LVSDEGVVNDKLQLDDNDPIFATTFKQMIKESFAEGKHFFVAKIVTKSNTTHRQGNQGRKNLFVEAQNHSHFFNAYGILKLLFKKKGLEFVGRFHEKFPITVKNPITNNVSNSPGARHLAEKSQIVDLSKPL
jgi:hypothetical protein